MPTTLAEEFDQLSTELNHLRRLGATRTPQQEQRYDQADQRIRQILATPPDGYTLPTAAQQLMQHAHSYGWQAEIHWTPPGWTDEVFVRVLVGRRMEPGELDDPPSDVWLYEGTWHSRGCAPGRLRLFGRILARTPEHPATHEADSVRAVRDVIAAHPAPVTA